MCTLKYKPFFFTHSHTKKNIDSQLLQKKNNGIGVSTNIRHAKKKKKKAIGRAKVFFFSHFIIIELIFYFKKG
jgi:hypothetical protein